MMQYLKKCIVIIFFVFILAGCSSESAGKEVLTNDPKQSNSLLSDTQILNIAHRGASGYAPEHTIASYEAGEQMAADYIEIDLQMTNDGQLIAMHDAEVTRTTNSDGFVGDFDLEEIKDLDTGSWFNEANPDMAQPVFHQVEIPTLDEIFQTFGAESNYYIETKTPEQYPDMVNELIAVLRKHNLVGENVPEDKVIIQSFSKESLLEVMQLEPSLPLVQLVSYEEKAYVTRSELKDLKEYAVGIGVNYTSLTEACVQEVRDADLLIHPFTVNEKEDMERLIKWGVTGMFTDYPDRLNEVLQGD